MLTQALATGEFWCRYSGWIHALTCCLNIFLESFHFFLQVVGGEGLSPDQDTVYRNSTEVVGTLFVGNTFSFNYVSPNDVVFGGAVLGGDISLCFGQL